MTATATAPVALKARDQYNAFVDSRPARIYAQLTHEFKTYCELCALANLRRSDVHSSFLFRLVRRNIVEQKGAGRGALFALKSAKKAPKSKKSSKKEVKLEKLETI